MDKTMDKAQVSKTVGDIIRNIGRYTNASAADINANDNLFGYNVMFTSRDMAYILLEIENKFGVNLESLIKTIEKSGDGYTVNGIAGAVTDLMAAHD